MITEERRDEKTPNGGDYSIVYYQDAEGQPASKEVATQGELVEFDALGFEIIRNHFTIPR